MLGRLPRILKVRRELLRHFIANPPDIFIGGCTDFNIGVELKLRRAGIKTVHYVSPSVWAWRQNRIHKIKAATDMVLAFLPFEKPSTTASMPLPFRRPHHGGRHPAGAGSGRGTQNPRHRRQPALAGGAAGQPQCRGGLYVAPVSRACKHLTVRYPDLGFIVPLVNQKRREQFLAIKAELAPDLDMVLLEGQGREAMIAADVVMLASGTAALEAMLVKKPMVVGYKLKPFSYWLAQRLVKTEFVSCPTCWPVACWCPNSSSTSAPRRIWWSR